MPAELSRKIGEEGEALARSFLKSIHWNIADENIDIACLNANEHERKAKPPTHGVDFIVAYDCPLVHTTRRNVLISMKNSAIEKTNNQTSKVKNDLLDLTRLMTCFRRSEVRERINQDSSRTKTAVSGLLIKVNKDKDAAESFLPAADEEKRLSLEDGAEVHFMENKRFDFVDLAVQHLKLKFDSYTRTYSYPPTTVNYAADVAEIEGALIPIQHLLGGPLTFRLSPLEGRGSKKELVIFSPDTFSDSDFSRLIGLANGCSQGWAHKITIIFPELSPSDKTKAIQIARGVKSQTFAESIEVGSFEVRSRLK